ncbi:MAG TPA: hypothetical protein VI479_20205, partial [Blastocatellia bacterium]
MGKGREIPLPESLINLIAQALTKAIDGKKIVIIEEDDEVSPDAIYQSSSAEEFKNAFKGRHSRVLSMT